MRVLLVSPPRNYPMRNEMYPSGALLLLGSLLKKKGHEVKAVHMVAEKMDEYGYERLLRSYQPDLVGFTVSTYQTKWTKLLLRLTRAVKPDILTVCGGAHPSALGAEFLSAFPHCDVAVQGEGELALLDLVSGKPLNEISGIHYHNGKIVTNPFTPLMDDLDALPLPDKSLVNIKQFNGLFPVGQRPAMFIMADRGCPYQCIFCSKAIYGNTLRLRSPANVMEEIEKLYIEWGIREIHFGNDTFNANQKWAHELLDLIIKYNYHRRLAFRVALRVNEKILNLELLKHLKAAGVWFVYYGVENGNQAMLDRMKKGITIEEVKRAFQLTHSLNIKTEAFFIIGMPGETKQTIQESHDLYHEIRPYWGGFSRAMPFPNTLFTKEAREAGHILNNDYDAYSPSSMVVRTDALSCEELERYVRLENRMADSEKMRKPKQVLYALKDKLS